jgi:hypothetical protein
MEHTDVRLPARCQSRLECRPWTSFNVFGARSRGVLRNQTKVPCFVPKQRLGTTLEVAQFDRMAAGSRAASRSGHAERQADKRGGPPRDRQAGAAGRPCSRRRPRSRGSASVLACAWYLPMSRRGWRCRGGRLTRMPPAAHRGDTGVRGAQPGSRTPITTFLRAIERSCGRSWQNQT